MGLRLNEYCSPNTQHTRLAARYVDDKVQTISNKSDKTLEMEMNTNNKLVINGNQTVRTVFSTKNKNAHLTTIPNLELKQTTIHPDILWIFTAFRCVSICGRLPVALGL